MPTLKMETKASYFATHDGMKDLDPPPKMENPLMHLYMGSDIHNSLQTSSMVRGRARAKARAREAKV